MRQLLPTPLDLVDPAGVSGGLGGSADHDLFLLLRSLADVVLVAADTVRAEGYGPSRVPVAVATRSCRLDWEAPFFTLARPLVVTVAAAPPEALARAAELAVAGLLDELCLTLSPRLVGGAAKRILDGPLFPGTLPPRLCSVCEQDGFLFLRYRPEPGR